MTAQVTDRDDATNLGLESHTKRNHLRLEQIKEKEV